MFENWVVILAVALSIAVGLGLGWMLRGRSCVTAPQRAELERLRSELSTAVGLQADKDARIATLEADLEAERTGCVRFEPEHRGAQLARRQFG
ncbi:MAG: hypothetical protein EP318_18260 [Rhodobacteraceae bacterium]|nr:MAG: hypothetical protein EP318_18260 [Paracoccaceae bacterium]